MTEPVTHEATDTELSDTDPEVYALACSCGTWETRGTTAEISAAFEAHLDAMGVPANELAQLEADQREARLDTLEAIRTLTRVGVERRTDSQYAKLMEAAYRLAMTVPANSEAVLQREV